MGLTYDHKQLAFNYVNRTACHQTQALKLYYIDNDLPIPTQKNLETNSSKLFQKEDTKAWIEYYRKENQERFEHLRDINLANLAEMIGNDKTNNKDKLAAIKIINDMCGFNHTNLNVNATAELDIVIGDED